ncbi:MAG: hypothetical protein EAZ47_10340, partial [Bacteroidetes bacterium]
MYVHQQANASQGAGNFGVFRYAKNYGVQNNIGFMITHRLNEADANKGFTEHHNTTFTVDGLIRPNNDVTIQYLISAARNNTNDSLGLAGNFFIGYNPQNYYVGHVTKFVDEKYIPGMGFVFAQNTMHHNPGGYYIWRPKGKLGKLIRRWDPGAFINWYQTTSNLQTQEVSA